MERKRVFNCNRTHKNPYKSRLCGVWSSELYQRFRVSPVMTTSIPLRVYFYHLNPQIALRNLGRKDGEKSGIKLYSNSRKTLINQGFWRLGCAWCFSDFESGISYSPSFAKFTLQRVSIEDFCNIFHFSSIK